MMETGNRVTPLRTQSAEDEARTKALFAAMRAQLAARAAKIPEIRMEGEAALRRLLPIAQSDTGQSGVIARFLLNLYNGNRFPFDMTDFRRLDYELFDDCMAVLKMDFQPFKEVHAYFEKGGAIWEQMAKDWNVKDFHGLEWRRAEK